MDQMGLNPTFRPIKPLFFVFSPNHFNPKSSKHFNFTLATSLHIKCSPHLEHHYLARTHLSLHLLRAPPSNHFVGWPFKDF